MNLATKVTFIRILIVPIFLLLLLIDTPVTHILALLLFIFGGVTDTIDGIIARRSNTLTKFGASIDPLADKLLITTALMYFLGHKELNIPVWTVITIVLRDYIVTWLRGLDSEKMIPADKTAKIKTVLQNITVISLLLVIIFKNRLKTSILEYMFLNLYPFISMTILAVFTLCSGLIYVIKYKSHITSQIEKS